MKISCEKCKILFKVDDKNLSADGITCLCPKCKHAHLVKRIVIPLDNIDKPPKEVPEDEQETLHDDSITKNDREPTIQKMMSSDMKSFKKLSEQAREEKKDFSKIIPYSENQSKTDPNKKITLEKAITIEASDKKKGQTENNKINIAPPVMPDPSLSMETDEPKTLFHKKKSPLANLLFQLLLGFIIILAVIFTMYILRVI